MIRSTPWAILLCKYKNSPDEPFSRDLFEKLFTARGIGLNGMVDYFFEVSHGSLDLSGSRVFGWLQLDVTREEASVMSDPRGWLVGLARSAAEHANIDLSGYFATLAFMNIGGGEGGTSDSPYGPFAFLSGDEEFPALAGQEMGHAYGLQHARKDDSTEDYQDRWDVMSAWNSLWAVDPLFEKTGPILSAANMRIMTWLDETRVCRVPIGILDRRYTLRSLTRRDLAGWLALELPGKELVELRIKERWDAGIPRSAVLVHRVKDGRSYIQHGTTPDPQSVDGPYKYDIGVGETFEVSQGSLLTVLTVDSIDERARSAVLHLRTRPRPASCADLLVRAESLREAINVIESEPRNPGDNVIPRILARLHAELGAVLQQARANSCEWVNGW